MNSLSWLIYLAGVASGVRGIFIACAVASLAASLFIGMYRFIENEEGFLKHWKLTIPSAFLFGLLASITPNRDTVYAIAASEMGEEVLATPEASKARQALNAWLDKQIDQKPEKSE